MAIRLVRSLEAWGKPEFEAALKQEVAALDVHALPLQAGLTTGSSVLDETPTVMVISVSGTAATIRAKVGVFYSGVLGGCSCADDPTPVEASNEYCEVLLEISKETAQATATLCDHRERGS